MPELAAVLAVMLLSASAASLGVAFARIMPRSLPRAERVALQVLAGLGSLGTALFLCGIWRLSLGTVLGLTALSLTPGALAIRRHFDWSGFKQSLGLGVAVHWRWEYAVVAAILLVRVISAFDLPRGTSDEISYHLLGPKIWLHDGRVHPVLANSYTAFPAIVEMLFAAATALSNVRAAGILTVVFAAILMVQAWGFAIRFGAAAPVARMAVLLSAATPSVIGRVGVGFVDCAFACFALAAARVLLELPVGWTAICGGLFLGFAVGVKYTGLLVCTVCVGLLMLPTAEEPSSIRRARRAAIVGLVALAVGCPAYVRNYFELGSPIYPPPLVFAGHPRSPVMPLKAIQDFNASMMNWGGAVYGRSALSLVLLPFRLTFRTPVFGGFLGGIGCAPLAFAPIGIARSWRNGFAMRAVAWVVLLGLFWFASVQELRFISHLLVVLNVFAAIGAACCLSQGSAAGRAIAVAALAVTIGHGVFLDFAEPWGRMQALFSGRGRQVYDPDRMPGAKAVEYINTHAEVAKVLVNGGRFKLYYLDKPFAVVQGEYGEQPNQGIPDFETALGHLVDLGVTHVANLANEGRNSLLQDPRLELVIDDEPISVYRVR